MKLSREKTGGKNRIQPAGFVRNDSRYDIYFCYLNNAECNNSLTESSKSFFNGLIIWNNIHSLPFFAHSLNRVNLWLERLMTILGYR